MRRRDFIKGITVSTAWPLTGRAQTRERAPMIGILMPFAADDPQYRARIGAFVQRLQEQGYINGRNVLLEFRASAGSADEIRRYATELVALAPNVILATGVSTVLPTAGYAQYSDCIHRRSRSGWCRYLGQGQT